MSSPSVKIDVFVTPDTHVHVTVRTERRSGPRRGRRFRRRREHSTGAHHDEHRTAARPAQAPSSQTLAPQPANSLVFRQAAEAYIAAHRGSWRSDKHAEQWEATLDRFAFPVIGDRSTAEIDVPAVLEVLEQPIDGAPFWNARAETARRVRGRIETILDWAKVRGHRDGENPARWKGNLEMVLPAKGPRVKHHAALPYAEIAPFMADLRTRNGITPRTLEFGVLTAARTGEAVGARWSEIDLDGRLWTIPGERMKGGREHRVPLTARCVEILRDLPRNGELVFPGRDGEQLSNMALLAVLKRMGRDGITVHGFRSTFRDWAAEQTSHQNEVVEMALAHTIGSKVEAAYRRGDLFEKRRRLMDDWAAACGVASAELSLPQAAE